MRTLLVMLLVAFCWPVEVAVGLSLTGGVALVHGAAHGPGLSLSGLLLEAKGSAAEPIADESIHPKSVGSDLRLPPENVLSIRRVSRTACSVRLGIASQGQAVLAVYDVTGRRVSVLADRSFRAGWHEIPWSGRSASGGVVGSGVYFFRLEHAGGVRLGRHVVVR